MRYLVAVAEAGSFSAAARRAFVTQPTLSAAVAALEGDLGVRLFERGGRGVSLTAEGRRALHHARNMLREGETLKHVGRAAAPARPLRLGILPTVAPALVTATLRRLRALDPSRLWRLDDAPPSALRQRLAAGRYDAIFGHLGRPAAGHRQIPLADDRQALAVARAARPRRAITPAFLQGQPLIIRTHCEQLQAASRILDQWGVRPLVVARTDSDARALELVATGLGACLMPDSFRHEGVVFVRPQGVDLGRRLGLEWIRGAAGGWFDSAAAGL